MAAEGRSPKRSIRAWRLTYRVTEPVLTPVRRVLPPVRIGTVALDLAFTVVLSRC
jgi:YggT family protein